MAGPNLLAAPVVTQGDRKKMVYLPAGTWYDYWTGEKISGDQGQWILRDAPLDTCPLYVKAGAVLPVWPKQNYVGEKDTNQVLMLGGVSGEGSWIISRTTAKALHTAMVYTISITANSKTES